MQSAAPTGGSASERRLLMWLLTFSAGPAAMIAPRSLRAAPLSPRTGWNYYLTKCRVQALRLRRRRKIRS